VTGLCYDSGFRFSDQDRIMFWAYFSDQDRIRILLKFFGSDHQISISAQHWWAWIGPGWMSCRILPIFSDQDWIWIFIFEKNWIRTGSVYLFGFYNEISLRVIQDVTNDGGSASLLWFLYSQKLKMILSVCAALISIKDNSCYLIVNFFPAKWK